MIYVLKNEQLTVEISSFGAEVMSVKRGDCEYIWQGGGDFWAGRTPLLCGFTGNPGSFCLVAPSPAFQSVWKGRKGSRTLDVGASELRT